MVATKDVTVTSGSDSVVIGKIVPCDANGDPIGPTSNPTAVQGSVASAATDSGNPVKVGGLYSSALPTFTNGQRGNWQINAKGMGYVQLGDGNGNLSSLGSNGSDAVTTAAVGMFVNSVNYVCNGSTLDRQRGDTNGIAVQSGLSSTFWNYAAASGGIANTTTAVTIKAAGGASVRNYLKTLTIAHDTLGAATELAIRDGAGGTVLWRGKLQTAAVDSTSAASIEFDPPLKGTANTLMEVVTLTQVTGGVFVNATGYTGA